MHGDKAAFNIGAVEQIGGAVPSSLDVYVAPGATRDLTFASNSILGATVKTNDGGSWLSLSLDGTGSFRFLCVASAARHMRRIRRHASLR